LSTGAFMKGIIIGATSGIGRELARQMSEAGYIVGITGRRSHLLDSLEKELPGECFKSHMDLTQVHESVGALEKLLENMGDVDIIVVNSRVGSSDPEFPLPDELETVAVNVTGFTTMANVAYHYFVAKQKGHIVGISSVAAVRGGPRKNAESSTSRKDGGLSRFSCRVFLSDCTESLQVDH
ncbi:MAG: SDR family NAD(P)-dependent oxidoreductase, partial [Xanthomonadaceae bacterium]|nr:SDR family NAD(P)-dependent oxidoreductase [Xanthomonadaceae bacterium]